MIGGARHRAPRGHGAVIGVPESTVLLVHLARGMNLVNLGMNSRTYLADHAPSFTDREQSREVCNQSLDSRLQSPGARLQPLEVNEHPLEVSERPLDARLQSSRFASIRSMLASVRSRFVSLPRGSLLSA